MRFRLALICLFLTVAVVSCGDDDESGTPVSSAATASPSTQAPATSAPTTTATTTTSTAPAQTETTSTLAPTTTRGPSAADSLLGFFEAARELDGAIGIAADLFNQGFDDEALTLDPEVFPLIETLDAGPVGAMIPPGLSPELEAAALAVFADLDSRIASLHGAARVVNAGDLGWILDCLANGGYSKSRFEGDYDRALALAAEEPPPTAPPDSVEGGILAVRIAAIRSMNAGCDSCGGVAYDTPIEVDWEGGVVAGGPEFGASFDNGAWEILIYAC
jgi:hypothetical protein